LADSRLLVAGGSTGDGATNVSTASVEIFNPATATWQTSAVLVNARYQHTATLLNNGRILITGGYQRPGSGTLGASELFLVP
jgi:N-acetylneuraminic acid mutarotase